MGGGATLRIEGVGGGATLRIEGVGGGATLRIEGWVVVPHYALRCG